MHKSSPAENSVPNLYHIVKNPDSLTRLKSNPAELLSASSADLNQVVLSGPNKGESALFWLCLFYHDNQLLDKIPYISSKITLDGLNAIIESGPFKGHSALYALSSSSAGRDFLSMIDPNIIQPSALTSQIHLPIPGRSALWHLTQFKPDILASTTRGTNLLRKMSKSVTIDQQFLSLIITKGPNKGRTVGFVINHNTLSSSTDLSTADSSVLESTKIRQSVSPDLPRPSTLLYKIKTHLEQGYKLLYEDIKNKVQCSQYTKKNGHKMVSYTFIISESLLNSLFKYEIDPYILQYNTISSGLSASSIEAFSSAHSPTRIETVYCANLVLTSTHLDLILPFLPRLTSASLKSCYYIDSTRAFIHCKTLTSLDLAYSQVSNLVPLSGLSTLTSLNFASTKVSDLSSLSGLSALTSLDLARCQKVKDFRPLSQLSALTHLNLAYTDISNLSSLSGLSALTSLDLHDTKVSNLSPLDSIPDLKISGKNMY